MCPKHAANLHEKAPFFQLNAFQFDENLLKDRGLMQTIVRKKN